MAGEKHLIPVRVDPTPYHDDPPNADLFYRVLGLYLVAWGRFEGHFVADLLTLSVLSWGTTPKHELPRAWARRVTFWKEAFKTLPQLAPVKADALALISDIFVASRDRSILFHAMWGGFLPSEPLALELISLKSEGDEFVTGNMPVTLQSLESMLRAANTLNTRLIPISNFLGFVRPPPPDARTILRPRESLSTPLRPRHSAKRR